MNTTLTRPLICLSCLASFLHIHEHSEIAVRGVPGEAALERGLSQASVVLTCESSNGHTSARQYSISDDLLGPSAWADKRVPGRPRRLNYQLA